MASRYWVTVAGSGTGNWSDTTHWSTTSGGVGLAAVPTASDDVFFDANSGTGTCTIDASSRVCRSIDCTGYTGTLAHGSGISLSIGDALGGALKFVAGMTYTPSGSASAGLRFVATSTNGGTGWPVTTGGKSMGVNGSSNQFTGVGGKWVLQDAWSQAAGAALNLTGGELNIGSLAHQTGSFNSSGSSVKSLTGTGSISLVTTSASTVWNLTGSNLTIASTITVIIGANSTNTRTIATNGVAQGTLTYTRSGSTGGLDITGGAPFTAINFSDASNARTLRFTAGTTTTITTAAGWNVNGTSGNLMTVTSITAATHTISVASGTVSSNYLSLSQSIATGGATCYAGANSTDGGGNTGWIFTAPVTTFTATAPTTSAAAMTALPQVLAALAAPAIDSSILTGLIRHSATLAAPTTTAGAITATLLEGAALTSLTTSAGQMAAGVTVNATLAGPTISTGVMTATDQVAATLAGPATTTATLVGLLHHPAVLAAPTAATGVLTATLLEGAALTSLTVSAGQITARVLVVATLAGPTATAGQITATTTVVAALSGPTTGDGEVVALVIPIGHALLRSQSVDSDTMAAVAFTVLTATMVSATTSAGLLVALDHVLALLTSHSVTTGTMRLRVVRLGASTITLVGAIMSPTVTGNLDPPDLVGAIASPQMHGDLD